MDLSHFDPLTFLLNALTSGVMAQHHTPENSAAAKAYQDLKTLLQRKYADLSDLPQLFLQFEQDPHAWQKSMRDALSLVQAASDTTILNAVGKLMVQINSQQEMSVYDNVNIGVQWFAQCRFENSTLAFYFLDGSHNTVPFLAPRQPPYDLVGRSALLHELKDQLFRRKSLALSALNGLPGVGKTALAIALAHDPEVLNHFCDGVLWAGLGCEADERKALSILGSWGTALGILSDESGKQTDIASRRERIQEAIGQRKMLLVADDAWDIDVAKHFNIGGSHCAYLLTTRFPLLALDLTGEGARVVQELKLDDGLLLLKQFVPHIVDAEPAKAQELVKAVDGLPLALILMGRYLRGEAYSGQPRRLQYALDQLQRIEERMKLPQSQIELKAHPSLPEQVPLSLWAAIEISDKALNEAARQQLRALSIFPAKPNTFSEEAAIAVSTLPASTLDTLTDYGLLESSGPARYTLHQVIADYASLQGTDVLAEEHMAQYFTELVEQHETDYEILEREGSNVQAALQIASRRGMIPLLLRGTNGFFHFQEVRGMYTQADKDLKYAQKAAMPGEGNTTGLMTVLLNLGRITEKMGNYPQAEEYLKEGLILARQDKHSEQISVFLQNLGRVAANRGDFIQAEIYFQEGLDLARQMNHSERISALLTNLGVMAGNHGDTILAEAYFQEALVIAKQIGHRERITGLLQNLGEAALQQGNFSQAKEYFQEGLVVAQQIGHRERVITLWDGLAAIALRQGEPAQAEIYYQKSLNLAQQIGHRQLICTAYINLGDAAKLRNYAQAEGYLQEALQLARELENSIVLVYALQNLGDVLYHRGDSIQAKVYLEEGLAIARKIEYPHLISNVLLALGDWELDQKNYNQAALLLKEGLDFARQIEQRENTCLALQKLGVIAAFQGDYALAEASLQEGLEIAHVMGDPAFIAGIINNRGVLYSLTQRSDLAYIDFMKAIETIPRGYDELIATIQFNLAQVMLEQNDYDEARRYGDASRIAFEQMGHKKASELKEWLTLLSRPGDSA